MASTYTPQDAIAIAKSFIHGIPVDSISFQICDITNAFIWRSFQWRWTIKSLTAVPLVNLQQDYSNVIPADFYRFKMVRVVQTNISPNEFRELDQKSYIPTELSRSGTINDIKIYSIESEITGIRLGLPPNIGAGVTMQLTAEYQFVPAKITDATQQTAFLFPDQYFDVFLEGLWAKFYQFADDPRAGEVQTDQFGRIVRATGQIARFYSALGKMAMEEDVASMGQESMFPEDPIGWTRQANPGLFGF